MERPYNPLRDGRRPEDEEDLDAPIGEPGEESTPPRIDGGGSAPRYEGPPIAPRPDAPAPSEPREAAGSFRNPLIERAKSAAVQRAKSAVTDRAKAVVTERAKSEVKKHLGQEAGKVLMKKGAEMAAKRGLTMAAGAATGGTAIVAIEAVDRLRKTRLGRAITARVKTRVAANMRRMGGNLENTRLSGGLNWIANRNPIYRFLLGFLPPEYRAHAGACLGCCSCCGCGGSCCSVGTCAAPLLALVIFTTIVYGLLFATPTPVLVEACYESDPVAAAAGSCQDIGPGFDITVAGEDFADQGGADKVAVYRSLEQAYGIPWFLLMGWEKIATDFGRQDYRQTTQITAPADISAVHLQAAVDAAAGQFATDTGETIDPAEVAAAEEAARSEARTSIARLSSELRGGGYGNLLISAAEYKLDGLFETPPAPPIPIDVGGTISPTALQVGRTMADYIGVPAGSPVWTAFAAQMQWENSGNATGNNPFNMADDAARIATSASGKITSFDDYVCQGTPVYAEFGQSGWWEGGSVSQGEFHCFASFDTLDNGARAAADLYVRLGERGAYGYDLVIEAARAGNLDGTARAIECSSWSTGHYGATCKGRLSISPGKIWATALSYAAENLGGIGAGGGLCSSGSTGDCTVGRPLDLWNRVDAGQVLSRSMLDAFRADGVDGSLVAPVDAASVDPAVARLVDSLIGNLATWESVQRKAQSNVPCLSVLCTTEIGPSRSTLHTILGWSCGVGGVCPDDITTGLPGGKPTYSPDAFVLGGNFFGDGFLGQSGWSDVWPAVRPYDPGLLASAGRIAKFDDLWPPLEIAPGADQEFARQAPTALGLASAYRDVLEGAEITLPTRLYICQRVMRAKAGGVLLWNGSYHKLDAEKTLKAVSLCNAAFPQVQKNLTLPEKTEISDNDTKLAAKLRQMFTEGYGAGPIYQPSYLNPQIGVGEEVRDWGAMTAVMSALLESPTMWGDEKRAYIDATLIGTNTDGELSGYQRARVNAYSRAIVRYAKSAYEWWSARELAIRRGSDPVAAARAVDIAYWGAPISNEISQAIDARPPIAVVSNDVLVGTLMADGVIYDGRSDAGGCRPWIGFNSLTGMLNDLAGAGANAGGTTRSAYALKRFEGVARLANSVPLAGVSRRPFPAAIAGLDNAAADFRSIGESQGVDPLILAAAAWKSSGYDPRYQRDGRYGLFGMTKADVDAWFPPAPENPPANWRILYLLDPAKSLEAAAKKIAAASQKGLARPEMLIAAFRSSIGEVDRAGSLDNLEPALASWSNEAMDVYRDTALLFGRTGEGAGIGSTGIGGCWRFGDGQAQVYKPGDASRSPQVSDGVAMNFCLPYLLDCGTVEVSRLDANGEPLGSPVSLPVVDYLDGDVGTDHESMIALRPGALARLGLSGDGPFDVRVRIVAPSAGSTGTTPYGGRDWGERWVWPREIATASPRAAISMVATALRLHLNSGPAQPVGLNPNSPANSDLQYTGRATTRPRGAGLDPQTLGIAYAVVRADDTITVRLDTLNYALGGSKSTLELRAKGCDSGTAVTVGDFTTKIGNSYYGTGSFGQILPYPADARPGGVPLNFDLDSAKAADWARSGTLGLCLRQAKVGEYPGAVLWIPLAVSVGGPLSATGTPGYLNYIDSWIDWSDCYTSPGGQRIEDPTGDPGKDGKRPIIWVQPWCDYLGRIAADLTALRAKPIGNTKMIVPDGSPYGEMEVSEFGYIWPFKGGWVTSGQEFRGNYFSSLMVQPSAESSAVPLHSGVDMSLPDCTSSAPGAAPIVAIKDGWLFIYSDGLESALNTPDRDDGGAKPEWYIPASQLVIFHDDGLFSFYAHVQMDTPGTPDPSRGGAVPSTNARVPREGLLNGKTVLLTVDGLASRGDSVLWENRNYTVGPALLPAGLTARFSDSTAPTRRISYRGRSYIAIRVLQGEVIGRIGTHLKSSCHLHLEIGVAEYNGTRFPSLLLGAGSSSDCPKTAFRYPWEGDAQARWCKPGSIDSTFKIDALSVLPKIDPEVNDIRRGVYCFGYDDAKARAERCRPDYRQNDGYPPRFRRDIFPTPV